MQTSAQEDRPLRLYGGRYVFGHRGLPGVLPENTLISFVAAAAVGATGIEFDLHLTADGEVVVIHDDTLDRTTTMVGAVEHVSLAELREASAGMRTHPRFTAERVPTLDETLAVAADLDLAVDLELKAGHRREELVIASVTAVERFFSSRPRAVAHPDGKGFLITSFERDLLTMVHRLRPRWRTGLLIEAEKASSAEWVQMQSDAARTVGASVLLPPLKAVASRPHLWEIDMPFIAFGDEFPVTGLGELVANPSFAGVIVNNPYAAIACLEQSHGSASRI
jgi:glycerophosphoryl diester phosphodiesterase